VLAQRVPRDSSGRRDERAVREEMAARLTNLARAGADEQTSRGCRVSKRSEVGYWMP
jgi:hypothetical protein